MIDPRAQKPGQFQGFGIDVQDVARCVEDTDGPGRRHLVKIVTRDRDIVHIDRVELEPGERCLGVEKSGLGLFQPRNYRVQGFQPRPGLPAWVGAVEKAAIDVFPQRAFHSVRMTFDKARHQDLLVVKAIIKRVIAPCGQGVQRTDAKDSSVSDRHMARLGFMVRILLAKKIVTSTVVSSA